MAAGNCLIQIGLFCKHDKQHFREGEVLVKVKQDGTQQLG